MSERNNLKAARDQLNAEREQIIEAAVASGAAIRVPVAIVANRGSSLEELKERKLAELRMAGEKREVFFDEIVIDTGIERDPNYGQGVSVDEPPKERVRPPEGEAIRAPEGLRAQYRPPQVNAPTTEPRHLRATIRLPCDRSPQGEIAEGYYQLVGHDMVLVSDASGNPLGRLTLAPGEDPETAARQLLKDKSGSTSNFWGPLRYRNPSIH